MSQHYFDTERQGEPIRVLLGWDPQCFFMVVERIQPEPDQEDYLFLSWQDAPPEQRSLAFLEIKLEELGIEVPPQMLDEVAMDQAFDRSERMVTYGPDGSFMSQVG